MQLLELSVSNYRILKEMTIPLSKFGCLIGENNSGKSSVLQAISLFFSGSKLSSINYYDKSLPIRIAVKFCNITDVDLARLAEEHRERIEEIIKDGNLTLVRFYGIDGKSSLLYSTLIPNDPRFSSDAVAELLRGQRAGESFASSVIQVFPELRDRVNARSNQTAVRQLIQELADQLPLEQKHEADQVLPTGIDKSIMPMLPEPIYIPAVKDLSDDTKTSESTPFGKILSILLHTIEPKISDIANQFAALNCNLNRVSLPDGTISDNRLEEVKLIESTVEKYVRESFNDVSLSISIPPPELKTILSSAQINVNDGVEGPIDSKGDGLRRAIVFSILRSYVELKASLNPELVATPNNNIGNTDISQPQHSQYFLLFEEPELFLHPKAQRILFDSLKVFATEHYVMVTTHSPIFLGPEATEIFIKLRKAHDINLSPHPYTQAFAVELHDMSAKDQFQLICFENNNAAFFADKVVLVEGDSDYLVFPHIAKTIDSSWDVSKQSVVFARISGKGNIKRYSDFFKRFRTSIFIIADLDLLISSFDQLNCCAELQQLQSDLIQRIDDLIKRDTEMALSTREIKEMQNSGDLKALYKAMQLREQAYRSGAGTLEELNKSIDAFFAWQKKDIRHSVLKSDENEEITQMKYQLLSKLREQGIFVLARGDIEQYYPSTVTGKDKPSKAQSFCSQVITREDVLACCDKLPSIKNDELIDENEFLMIFETIFS